MKKIAFYSVLLCCIVACGKAENLKEDAVFDPRYPETDSICRQTEAILAKADNVFMHANYLVELYVNYNGGKNMIKVENFDAIDENREVEFSYNLIRYENGEIMYVAEFPYSESGDWENIYESIFDEQGDLLLFVRKSSFFRMVEDGVAYEKSEYFYNHKHKLLKKTYKIEDNNGQPIVDTANLPLFYRYPYEQYTTREAWLKAHGLEK